MGKIDFSVGEFDTRVQFYKQEITRTDAGAIVKDFIKTTEAFAGVSSKTLDETVGGERIRVVEVLELTSYFPIPSTDKWHRVPEDFYYLLHQPTPDKFPQFLLRCHKLMY